MSLDRKYNKIAKAKGLTISYIYTDLKSTFIGKDCRAGHTHFFYIIPVKILIC